MKKKIKEMWVKYEEKIWGGGHFFHNALPFPPKENLKWHPCTEQDMRCCEISCMTLEQRSQLVSFLLVVTHLSRFDHTKVFVNSEKYLKIITSKTTVDWKSQKLFERLTIKETNHTRYHYGSIVKYLLFFSSRKTISIVCRLHVVYRRFLFVLFRKRKISGWMYIFFCSPSLKSRNVYKIFFNQAFKWSDKTLTRA